MLIIFLTFFLVVGLIAILYLNIASLVNYNQGLKLNIINTSPKCTPASEKDLLPSQICQEDKSKEFIQKDGITYELGNNPVQYIQVCSQLCSGNVNVNGECQPDSKTYDNCISFLRPQSGCSDVANPVSSIENNLLYAQKILTRGC